MKPHRVQLKRIKGWRLPPNTVVVARPSMWGNPFSISKGDAENAQEAVDMYRQWLHERISFQWEIKRELKGKNLACWCGKSSPCHADVLLEIANNPSLLI